MTAGLVEVEGVRSPPSGEAHFVKARGGLAGLKSVKTYLTQRAGSWRTLMQPCQWLCHSDARQVFDLPAANAFFFQRSLTSYGHRPIEQMVTERQVEDLPRISVAEPMAR